MHHNFRAFLSLRARVYHVKCPNRTICDEKSVHLKETQLENSTCFIQSSSYSRDSIIYKNDKEINSPESESRKQRKERLMAGFYLIGGFASGMQPSINGEDWVPQISNISSAVASTPASTRTIFKAAW